MKKRLNKKGFTLIELIVVIAILGILAAIAVPRLSAFTDKAKIGAIKANEKIVVSALNTVYADANDWPADLAGVKNLLSTGDFLIDGTNLILTDTSGGIHTWNPTTNVLTTTSTTVTTFVAMTYTADTGTTTP